MPLAARRDQGRRPRLLPAAGHMRQAQLRSSAQQKPLNISCGFLLRRHPPPDFAHVQIGSERNNCVKAMRTGSPLLYANARSPVGASIDEALNKSIVNVLGAGTQEFCGSAALLRDDRPAQPGSHSFPMAQDQWLTATESWQRILVLWEAPITSAFLWRPWQCRATQAPAPCYVRWRTVSPKATLHSRNPTAARASRADRAGVNL